METFFLWIQDQNDSKDKQFHKEVLSSSPEVQNEIPTEKIEQNLYGV